MTQTNFQALIIQLTEVCFKSYVKNLWYKEYTNIATGIYDCSAKHFSKNIKSHFFPKAIRINKHQIFFIKFTNFRKKIALDLKVKHSRAETEFRSLIIHQIVQLLCEKWMI